MGGWPARQLYALITKTQYDRLNEGMVVVAAGHYGSAVVGGY